MSSQFAEIHRNQESIVSTQTATSACQYGIHRIRAWQHLRFTNSQLFITSCITVTYKDTTHLAYSLQFLIIESINK
jgi:hypothetical protein